MPGSPYTGSTLLGFLLHSHPDCASIGAATGLTPRVDVATYRCSCGALFVDCPFWKSVATRTMELGRPVDVYQTGYWSTHVRMSRRRWLNGLLVRSLGAAALTDARDAVLGRLGPIHRTLVGARSSTWSLARAVLDVTGRTVFVDTARDHQRPGYLAPARDLDVRAIHLVRDPRGNVASIMRHTGVDVAKAARQWKHYNVEADRVRRFLPDDSWMRLHYEALCLDPQATLDRIARFVGVAPAPLPNDLGDLEHHIIGNSMRLQTVEGIHRDERWRRQLDDSDLAVIARIAGATSHALGYDWP
ncbi:MAG TPA: sulfotransferase [Euzebyales bacterium]|nr:sulfotransferase [Euzebyales bacterium]